MDVPRRPGGSLAKHLDENYTDLRIFWAREFEDHYVFNLRHPDDFFREKEMKLYKAAGAVPDLAQSSSARVYGKRGFPVRGLDIDGREVFYRPPEKTLEGWWLDLLASPGREGEVLCVYAPHPWRTLLPKAPKRIELTRKHLSVLSSGRGREAFPLCEGLRVGQRFSVWSVLGVLVMLLPLVWTVVASAPNGGTWASAWIAAVVLSSLVGSLLFRSQDVRVKSDLPGARGPAPGWRRYSVLGRDPALSSLLETVRRYRRASAKRYRRELSIHDDGPFPPNPW